MMPGELGETEDPLELVPGRVAAILENVRVLRARRDDVRAAGEALRRIDTGAWTGEAANKFHEQHHIDVPRWLKAGDCLEAGSLTLEQYAHSLAEAQGQAAEAVVMWDQARAAEKQAINAYRRDMDLYYKDMDGYNQRAASGQPVGQPPELPEFSDPEGDRLRQQARDLLADARGKLAEAGERAAEVLREQGALAPQDSQKLADANFYGGIWSNVEELGQALWVAVTDPSGTVAAAYHNLTHPVETFKEAVAWGDWANGHGDRALGKNTGGILLGFGAGKILKALLTPSSHHKPPSGNDHPKHPNGQAEHVDGPTEHAAAAGEKELLATVGKIRQSDPLESGERHVNAVDIIPMNDGGHAVYKPSSGESSKTLAGFPAGGTVNREVAAARLDKEFGFDLVPPTAHWDGPKGEGALQRFVEDARMDVPPEKFPMHQREQMAVFDYVLGSTDRHGANYLGTRDDRLVGIDHGYTFPEQEARPLRSSFVADSFGKPLSSEVLHQVQGVDPRRMGAMLRDSGISEQAVDRALQRLQEVQQNGKITGESWNADIVTEHFRPVRRR